MYSIAMDDHACILIWDAHARMGHNIVPYAYGISHMRMGKYMHMGQNSNKSRRCTTFSTVQNVEGPTTFGYSSEEQNMSKQDLEQPVTTCHPLQQTALNQGIAQPTAMKHSSKELTTVRYKILERENFGDFGE